jgi:hypothetical protein
MNPFFLDRLLVRKSSTAVRLQRGFARSSTEEYIKVIWRMSLCALRRLQEKAQATPYRVSKTEITHSEPRQISEPGDTLHSARANSLHPATDEQRRPLTSLDVAGFNPSSPRPIPACEACVAVTRRIGVIMSSDIDGVSFMCLCSVG